GDHVCLCHRTAVEAEDAEMLNGSLSLARRYRQCTSAIAHHLARVELHAPGGEQVAHLRGLVCAHRGERILRVGARLVCLGERIDERDDVSATERVLVDGELSGR